ncbi:TetR/AcrR family transcriptional regulator [Actinocorallia lasiicapitis]
MKEPEQPPATPRERLLETAARLFYAEGIHALGVDRLVTEARVTRATFYRHFPSKDDLVLAYLGHHDRLIRGGIKAAVTGQEPRRALSNIFTGMAGHACGPGFRGCPFINAAAEYPDPSCPVRLAVDEHRTWLRGTLRALLVDVGHPSPDLAAQSLLFLRDGIMVGSYLDSPATVTAAVQHVVDATLAA